jgi:hypothetical protein
MEERVRQYAKPADPKRKTRRGKSEADEGDDDTTSHLPEPSANGVPEPVGAATI